METCPHCGASISVGDKTCLECGKRITSKKPVYKGKSYFLHRVIAFFIPLLGLILFILQRHSNPLASKITLKWSFIGLLFYFILFALVILFYVFIIIGILT